MLTRKQRLANECSHSDYYAQFVDDSVIRRVLTHIGKKRLIESRDEHLNDIALKAWDRVLLPFPKHIGDKMRSAGDYPTMAGAVCIAKEAARQIIASEVTA